MGEANFTQDHASLLPSGTILAADMGLHTCVGDPGSVTTVLPKPHGASQPTPTLTEEFMQLVTKPITQPMLPATLPHRRARARKMDMQSAP
jgi:hypothetical protein